MSQRSVLVLNHFARSPSAPGGTRHVELFSRLKGWDARIIASNRTVHGGQKTAAEGILETVWVLPPGSGAIRRLANWLSYCVGALLRGLRTPKPDVVVGSTPHLLAPLTALAIARLRRVPLVLEVRDIWPRVFVEMGAMSERSLLYRALTRLEQYLYRTATKIVVLAQGASDYLVAQGVPREKIAFIPNGANPNDYHIASDREVLRQRYEFTGIVAIYAGAHGPANGLDQLIKAARELEDVHSLSIVLVGDGVEKARLRKLVGDQGIMNVQFLDPVPKSQIPELLHAADIGIHCLADVPIFRSGVSPNKIYDYMAAGLPIVTNTPGEVAELIEQAQAGVGVPPDQLSAGLRHLVGLSPSARARMGELGRDFLARNRSHSALARELQVLLDEVAG